jgi:hypothetical protein
VRAYRQARLVCLRTRRRVAGNWATGATSILQTRRRVADGTRLPKYDMLMRETWARSLCSIFGDAGRSGLSLKIEERVCVQ